MNRFVIAVLACLLVSAAEAPFAGADGPRIVVLKLDGTVQPASLHYLERGLRAAEQDGAALVLLELNTPGGTLVSLRSMTTALLESKVPVVAYVTPAGGRAASAGFFLLMAADVAAMAPGTNTGAAHPVSLGGDEEERGDQAEKRKGGSVAITKATEDAAALVRSLASVRHRPVTWAEGAVRESRSYSADEAKRYGLVELLASDRTELIRQLDGDTVRRADGSTQTLALTGATVVTVAPTTAERILMVIAHPQVAYLLLMLGLLGLLIELASPGIGVPGVAGAVSLLLALYAFSVLPVSWVGALLMLTGLGLLIAEAFVASYGLLGLAGVVAFVLGSLMLVDTPLPGWRIGLDLALPVAVVLGGTCVLLMSRAWRASRAKVLSGVEGLVGEEGELTSGIEPAHEGKVFVHGEYWAATSAEPLPPGARVRVEKVEGLRLRVAPVAAQA